MLEKKKAIQSVARVAAFMRPLFEDYSVDEVKKVRRYKVDVDSIFSLLNSEDERIFDIFRSRVAFPGWRPFFVGSITKRVPDVRRGALRVNSCSS